MIGIPNQKFIFRNLHRYKLKLAGLFIYLFFTVNRLARLRNRHVWRRDKYPDDIRPLSTCFEARCELSRSPRTLCGLVTAEVRCV